jgi:hypothetical protein
VVVVVHVGLLPVLPLLVLVGIVDMGERRVVVLVIVFRRQVGSLLALDHVVGDVGVLVLVDLRLVAVLLSCHLHAPPERLDYSGVLWASVS